MASTSISKSDRRRVGLAATALAAAVVLTVPASAADIRVSVADLHSDKGNVHVALFDTPATFAQSEGVVMERIVPAATPEAVFENVAPGTYALVTFHDESGNGEFDKNFIGYPLEGYAFSNGVRPVLSAPPFETASFVLPPEGMAVTLVMVY